MFLFGYVFGPVLWGPGAFPVLTPKSAGTSQCFVASELFGRRAVLLVVLSIYLLTFIGQALAHNMETLLIMRFFGGVFGSAPLATGGGILADMWDVPGRTAPSAVFLTSVFIGPSLATIVGGL
jgi:DHA1 family multidrug resistance protein-like MFS transporter